jgi:hypothetical protein
VHLEYRGDMDNDIQYQFTLDPKSDTEITDGMFDILKAYFDSNIREVEKYAAANISVLISQAFTAVCGKDTHKGPSKKQTKKIKDRILKKIRFRYGKFFDITEFSYKNRRDSFRFNTNLHYSYKHKMGILYGHAPDTFLRPLFYTTHSLERFQERVDPELYKMISLAYRKLWGSEPTPAAILDVLIRSSHSWGYDKRCQYMNVIFGSLVIEKFRHVLVCKTFLTPDMLKDGVEWKRLEAIDIAGEKQFHMNKLTDLFEHKSAPAEPIFYNEMGPDGEELIGEIARLYRISNLKFSSR